ncbi:MAG TPA: YdcF family protein [Vicinamibacterales bacterium]
MAQTFKLFLVPGSVQFLAIGLVAGVALLYGGKRPQRWGRLWLTGLVAFYLVLCTPVGSDIIAAPLAWQYGSLASAEQAKGVDTIVALTTGTWVYQAGGLEVDEMGKPTSHNAMEAARIYRMLGSPMVIATGGIVLDGQQRDPESVVMAEGLVRLGVPRERIILETRSRTTREQAMNSSEMLRRRGTKRFVLITDSEHMPRAMSMFRAQGLDPVPSVAALRDTTPPGLVHRLRPTIGAYLQGDRACYEYLARLYYWSRGLLGLEKG